MLLLYLAKWKTVYRRIWSFANQLQVECRTGKVRRLRPTFYHCTTQPTSWETWICIAPRRERTSKALRYGARSQGISQLTEIEIDVDSVDSFKSRLDNFGYPKTLNMISLHCEPCRYRRNITLKVIEKLQ